MSILFARDNPQITMKRVYYEGTDTLKKGYCLCYNWDTTDNIHGVNGATGAAGSTTAEGYQNEGKYIRVEKPATDNLHAFAGVVANDNITGPCWVDIYTPDGGVVPVYTSADTSGATTPTALYITNASYVATSTSTDNKLIGYAFEKVDRSTTNGLNLTKLVAV